MKFDFQKVGLSDHKFNDYSLIFSAAEKTTYVKMIIGKASTCKKISKIKAEIIKKYLCQFATNEKFVNLSEINFILEVEPNIIFKADPKMIEQVFVNIYKKIPYHV